MSALVAAWAVLQLLVVVTWCALALVERAVGAGRLATGHAVLVGRVLVVATLTLPLALLWVPAGTVYTPPAQVWSGAPVADASVLGVARPVVADAVVAGQWIGAGALVLALLLVGRAAYGAWSLHRLLRAGRVLHYIGRVRVVEVPTGGPFAFWLPGAAWVALTPVVTGDPEHRLLAVRHELQHHRGRDPIWAHALLLLRLLCLPHPAAHAAVRRAALLDELRCDAAVLARRPTLTQAYGRLLLVVARAAHPPAVAVAMAAPSALRRRVDMLLDRRPPTRSRLLAATLGAASLAVLAMTAFATDGLVGLNDVTRAQVEASVSRVGASLEVPVSAHPAVVERLGEYLATPSGRSFTDDALRRYAQHAAAIDEATARHGVPAELAAVAFVESGFRNDDRWAYPTPEDEAAARWRGAGMWMFIPATARTYGMAVGPDVDERLDLAQETEAAMRYLAGERAHFGDWLLAVASYNQGRTHVQRAIDFAGTSDPWALVEGGHLNGYVPAFVAAVLILEDESLR